MKLLRKIFEHDEVRQILRFGIVGVGATCIHMIVAALLSFAFDAPLILINVIAFLVAFTFSFYGHYHWTFSRRADYKKSLVRFFAIALTGLAASTATLSALIHINLGNDIVKLLISIVVIPMVTYYAGKIWAFKNEG